MKPLMTTASRPTRRRPLLGVEELSRRDVWSATLPDATLVVHDLSLSVPAAAADWKTLAFITPDGVSHPAELSIEDNRVVGRWDEDFTLPNISVVTIRLAESIDPIVRYRELPVLLMAWAGPVASQSQAGMVSESQVFFGDVPGTLSVTADKPVWLWPTSPSRDFFSFASSQTDLPPAVIPPPPAPPVVISPPAAQVPPPGPAGPVGPADTVPPPATAVVPPPVVPPPRPPDPPPVAPVFFVSSQLDHQAGTFGTLSSAATRPDALGDGGRGFTTPVSPPSREADRIILASWNPAHTLFSAPTGIEPWERSRASNDSQPVESRTSSDTRRTGSPSTWQLGVVRSELTLTSEPTVRDMTMSANAVPDEADELLARLAARPLLAELIPTEADQAEPKKKHAHVMSVFGALVLGGVCFRWFWLRSDETAPARPVGLTKPPIV
ncbi:hypothetical protein [Limnoglobus roseus]|uniref:Uncharacterized protein n=1 Tax=Limnoglobus roseus TaxID=2598579 RepID=A0A5C1A987_9BACT|nr:hypothetical protein [Limnoglobus roseus]QEL13674.1 hypothetical protein PX52LOC_00532 [Limnoglobus roseus]